MMRAASYLKSHMRLSCALWIALCFALTSAVYLSWVYRLVDQAGAAVTDWLTMVAGYLCQAGGMALVSARLRRTTLSDPKRVFCLATALLAAAFVPALVSISPLAVMLCGMLMNLFCGVIAGYYLYALAARSEGQRLGLSFGGGYALSTIAVFLLSLIGSGSFLTNRLALPVYLLLAACAAGAVYILPLLDPPAEPVQPAPEAAPLPGRTFALACGTIALVSLVKNLGFSFPSADIATGMRPEMSRLFYAFGLAAAGCINDKSRKNGAVCTVAALVIPFIMLAVSGEPVSGAICWGLDYLFYGFFSVFRVALFLDVAIRTRRWCLAPLGLLWGRVGDAAGTGLCLALAEQKTALVALTAGLFMVTVFLFFHLYQRLYEPEAQRQRSEKETFEAFSAQHDLSAREREVMRLLIAEKSNGEIAEALFVSESTVKYHVHNLLKKTGCKSRMDLIGKYAAALYPRLEQG